jgi:hypothetical protein
MPDSPRLTRGLQDLAHEFVSCLAAAQEMQNSKHETPVNHLIQDAFLVHYRALREFFRGSEDKDNVQAVHCVDCVAWNLAPFQSRCGIEVAINKCLSHLTYSRDPELPDTEMTISWDGPSHLVGAVRVLLEAWGKFTDHILPDLKQAFQHELEKKAGEYRLDIEAFKRDYEIRARRLRHRADDLPRAFLCPIARKKRGLHRATGGRIL